MNTDLKQINTDAQIKTINKKEFLEKELSYKIIGCFFSVSNKYGKGLKEIIYQKALAEELKKEKLSFQEQKRINIYSTDTGKLLGTYIPDFIVEDKIIIELKATDFTPRSNYSQQLSYLKSSKYEISYLVNFCTPKIEIKRTIYTNNRKPFIALLENN